MKCNKSSLQEAILLSVFLEKLIVMLTDEIFHSSYIFPKLLAIL